MDHIAFSRNGTDWLLRTSQLIPRPRAEVFPFFADAANLARITPADMAFRILTPMPVVMRDGARIEYRVRVFGIPVRWRTVITRWDPPTEFEDTQVSGPYRRWLHVHRFEDRDGETLMYDIVRFRLPFGWFGLLGAPLVRRQLRRIFEHRAAVIREMFPAT